jgi:hypothetical protein
VSRAERRQQKLLAKRRKHEYYMYFHRTHKKPGQPTNEFVPVPGYADRQDSNAKFDEKHIKEYYSRKGHFTNANPSTMVDTIEVRKKILPPAQRKRQMSTTFSTMGDVRRKPIA